MYRPATPFDQGYSDGEIGLKSNVPREYTAQQQLEYYRGYNQGYEYYLRKLDMSQRPSRPYSGPYIDSSWIPKDGKYS